MKAVSSGRTNFHSPQIPLTTSRRRRNSALFCRWSFDRTAPARPKILRPTLPSRPPRTISSHDRQRTPHRYALSFEIVFDGHCDHSPTDAGDSQIPMARAADRRPSDSRFPSGQVFERRPRLGPTASLCKGPTSENLHRSRHRVWWPIRRRVRCASEGLLPGVGSTLIYLYPLKGSARRRLGSRRTSPCHFTEPATAPASRWCAPGGPDIRSSAVARSTCRGRRRCRLLPCRSAWPRAARRPSRRPLA